LSLTKKPEIQLLEPPANSIAKLLAGSSSYLRSKTNSLTNETIETPLFRQTMTPVELYADLGYKKVVLRKFVKLNIRTQSKAAFQVVIQADDVSSLLNHHCFVPSDQKTISRIKLMHSICRFN